MSHELGDDRLVGFTDLLLCPKGMPKPVGTSLFKPRRLAPFPHRIGKNANGIGRWSISANSKSISIVSTGGSFRQSSHTGMKFFTGSGIGIGVGFGLGSFGGWTGKW